MGLFVTDARDATLTRRRTSLQRTVGDNTPARHRNARGLPVRPQTPLRGPIRRAISGYRFYSPELGRWVNRDPIFPSQGYLLLWNDAVNLLDLLGLTDYKIVYYEIGGPYHQLAQKARFNGKFGAYFYRLSYKRIGQAQYEDEQRRCKSQGWFSCTACYEYRSTRKQTVEFYLTDQQIVFPKWDDYHQGSEAEQAAWDAFIDGLMLHEEGHRIIAREMEGMKHFEATGEWGALWWARQDADDKWFEKVNKEWEIRNQENQKLQHRYDRDTNDGATQGAVLPQI